MPFVFQKSEIPDVIYIEPAIYRDERGHFAELYKSAEFAQNGISKPFVQVNHSRSKKGVLRGMHYQNNPAAQGKLVNVTHGEIFDVAVDIRKGSPTFGRWVGRRLSADQRNMLYIPEGFAHGFCVLSETAEVTYYCTQAYSSQQEGGIIWNDPQLMISWPLSQPIVSDKDNRYPTLKQADHNFIYERTATHVP